RHVVAQFAGRAAEDNRHAVVSTHIGLQPAALMRQRARGNYVRVKRRRYGCPDTNARNNNPVVSRDCWQAGLPPDRRARRGIHAHPLMIEQRSKVYTHPTTADAVAVAAVVVDRWQRGGAEVMFQLTRYAAADK